MSETYGTPMFKIARAARLRDWQAVDAALDEALMLGRDSVLDGRIDADKELGRDRLPGLSAPDPVTLFDLPDRKNIKIKVDKNGNRMIDLVA